MSLLGNLVVRARRAGAAMLAPISNSSPPYSGGGWFSVIREPFGGAWQQSMEDYGPREITAFSAVFACVSLIASDIAKLRFRLVKEEQSGICTEVPQTNEYAEVMQSPNHFQNRIKFIEQWVISKLLYGNTYALKKRNGRRIVKALYVLDPAKVQPLVTVDGDVYYRIARDDLQKVGDSIVVPASEIIHDMMVSLWHPLVGVSPIYSAAMSAVQGMSIQKDSTKFFKNLSRPGGQLTSTGTINDETANRLKQEFEENFSGEKIGRFFVGGDGLKFEPITMPAQEAQLIEQLRWTVEDVARCFHVPLFKLGIPEATKSSTGLSLEALNQAYYTDCLQALIESLEECLTVGLGLQSTVYAEADLDGLLRMDQAAQIEALTNSVKGGVHSPDEARKKFNLPPVPGGKYPYLQQQNYSLEALAKRDAKPDPFEEGPKAAPPAANDDDGAAAYALAKHFMEGLQ